MSTLRTIPMAMALSFALSAPAFALNPQPLPPIKLPPLSVSRTTDLTMVKHPIIPPACRGPIKFPNPCM